MSCSTVNIHIPFNPISLIGIYPEEICPPNILNAILFIMAKKKKTNYFSDNMEIVVYAMLIQYSIGTLNNNTYKKSKENEALTGWLSWLEHGPHTPRLQVWSQSGHMQESTNECISQWSNKSMFLSFSKINK